MMLEPVVGGYPKGGRLLVDTWLRDIAIGFLVKSTIERWSLRRWRAACLVALALRRHGINLGGQQVERIFRERGTIAERIVAFMTAQF